MLRAAASVLGRAGSGAARAAAQQQQVRTGHELSAHTNKHVEKWLSRREDIEQEFTWSKSHTRAVVLGAFLLPIATYNMLVYMAHEGEGPCAWAGDPGAWGLSCMGAQVHGGLIAWGLRCMGA
jgi:hypothetical protein